MNKKGVSPLIATVLLLAFVVSLLTVVIQLNPFSNECSGVDLIIEKNVCFDQKENMINIFLKNLGKPISVVKIMIDGANDDFTYEEEIKLNKDKSKVVQIPFNPIENGRINDIMIIPKVTGTNGKLVECRMKDDISSIQGC